MRSTALSPSKGRYASKFPPLEVSRQSSIANRTNRPRRARSKQDELPDIALPKLDLGQSSEDEKPRTQGERPAHRIGLRECHPQISRRHPVSLCTATGLAGWRLSWEAPPCT